VDSPLQRNLKRNSKWIQFGRNNWKSFLVVALTILFVQDVFGTHGVLAMRRSQKEAIQMRQQISRLTDENCQLAERVQDLKSDPGTIEQIAREQMGLAKQGDYIFKVPQKSHDGLDESGEVVLHADSLQRCQQAAK
jgi:cell division protein FtsB